MDRRTVKQLKAELKPFLDTLQAQGKGLYYSCINPLMENDNTTPFVLEVQAAWIDGMDCFDAIQYLFKVFKDSEVNDKVLKSLFAIKVVSMDDEVRCSQHVRYLVHDSEPCHV